MSVSPQHLHKLLSSSDLNIENEKQVYNAAIKWLLANPQHHTTWLDEILAQVGQTKALVSSLVWLCNQLFVLG